ncbi:hypothetical protein HNQ07_004166 [Deinococcus metalli]|uniref:Uncharacterized protein n=1 Tax=Deinococcus metalli TaxID=1141878 RepID=A0A7W8KLA7_9DEIO|nr:hypothetical protein [Deinococcus metalli]MBB5378659.1 hypothetical protein [Deinococcus metalli]GHF61477.1 hypothetical protein GCM10017781_42060 [Deinococcus metalli]
MFIATLLLLPLAIVAVFLALLAASPRSAADQAIDDAEQGAPLAALERTRIVPLPET